MVYFKSSFVDGWHGVRDAEKDADGAPQFARVVDAWTVSDDDARAVEQVYGEAADTSVRSGDGNVPLPDVGGIIRTALAHQICPPLVEDPTSCRIFWKIQEVSHSFCWLLFQVGKKPLRENSHSTHSLHCT